MGHRRGKNLFQFCTARMGEPALGDSETCKGALRANERGRGIWLKQACKLRYPRLAEEVAAAREAYDLGMAEVKHEYEKVETPYLDYVDKPGKKSSEEKEFLHARLNEGMDRANTKVQALSDKYRFWSKHTNPRRYSAGGDGMRQV